MTTSKTKTLTTRPDSARKTGAVRTAAVRSSRARKSDILSTIHQDMAGLHAAGAIPLATMRKFDEICLAPVTPLAPRQIANIRRSAGVSQPVFARFLNVSKSSVSQWESGAKKPDGAALKLINLVARKGLDAIA
jgi:putative transcriptional regulator